MAIPGLNFWKWLSLLKPLEGFSGALPAPQGHSQWSVRLLADKAVEMKLVEEIAPSTVFYILKKTKSNRTGKGNGASHS